MPMHNGRNRIADRQRKTSRKPTKSRQSPAKGQAATPPCFPIDVRVPTGAGNRFLAVTPQPAPLLPAQISEPQTSKAVATIIPPKRRLSSAPAGSPRQTPATIATPQAIPLPNLPEPQTLPHPPSFTAGVAAIRPPTNGAVRPSIPPTTDLPRHRSLARPDHGLVSAISNWLRSAKSLFLVTKRRPTKTAAHRPPRYSPKRMPAPSLREQAELTQLRAENRRLRSELEALLVLQNSNTKKPAAPEPERVLGGK